MAPDTASSTFFLNLLSCKFAKSEVAINLNEASIYVYILVSDIIHIQLIARSEYTKLLLWPKG